MAFLAQVFAPIEDLLQSYNRILYVFACPEPKCAHSGKEAAVLRYQSADSIPVGKLVEEKSDREEPDEEEAIASEERPKKSARRKSKKKAQSQPQQQYVIEVSSEEPELTAKCVEKSAELAAKLSGTRSSGARLLEEIKSKAEEDEVDSLPESGKEEEEGYEYENRLLTEYMEKQKSKDASSAEAEMEQVIWSG